MKIYFLRHGESEANIERGIGVLGGTDNDGGKLKVSIMPDNTERAESIADLKYRVRSFLNNIAQKHANQTVLVVGHGATIKMMLSLITGNRWEDVRDTHVPNCVPFQFFEEVT